jgi:hypothetical protein
MSGAHYNGYSWRQRNEILKAYHRGEAGQEFTLIGKPCGLCGDPNRAPGEWHSEDYSPPYSFEPPQTYPMCKPCHGRLHKRFNQSPAEWELFIRHIDAGGYGREFTALYSVATRAALVARIGAGEFIEIAIIRERIVVDRWWHRLTLDSESLVAPWARPRPWRPRPDAGAFSTAIAAVGLSDVESAILRFHAQAERRTVTMRQVAAEVLGSAKPSAANLAYGRLARRIGKSLGWIPDCRADGSPIWMSVIAEGWQPPKSQNPKREFEWVMLPVLVSHFR